MPDSVLVDTNVAIYLATEHSLAGPYLSLIEGRAQALSFASAAELTYTSRRSRNPRRATLYWRSWFPRHAVLFPDHETCDIWAEITAECHRRGRPREHNDLWIAATALQHALPLVTHNVRDFADIPGLTVLSISPLGH